MDVFTQSQHPCQDSLSNIKKEEIKLDNFCYQFIQNIDEKNFSNTDLNKNELLNTAKSTDTLHDDFQKKYLANIYHQEKIDIDDKAFSEDAHALDLTLKYFWNQILILENKQIIDNAQSNQVRSNLKKFIGDFYQSKIFMKAKKIDVHYQNYIDKWANRETEPCENHYQDTLQLKLSLSVFQEEVAVVKEKFLTDGFLFKNNLLDEIIQFFEKTITIYQKNKKINQLSLVGKGGLIFSFFMMLIAGFSFPLLLIASLIPSYL